MPTFNDVEAEVKTTVDIDFEVYCGTCGAGICNNCTTNKTRNRMADRLDVDPCEKCLKSAREEEGDIVRAEMQERIDELEFELK